MLGSFGQTRLRKCRTSDDDDDGDEAASDADTAADAPVCRQSSTMLVRVLIRSTTQCKSAQRSTS